MTETNLSVVLSLIVSTVISLIGLSAQCSEQHECLRHHTCVELDADTCSFANVVSASGWRLFNASNAHVSMEALERGVCTVGNRQTMTASALKCVRHRSYPDATETEIMKPSSQTYHEAACGAWIDTQASVGRMWAFYDEDDVAKDVADALFAKHRVRTASGAPSKFRSACVRMTTSGAAGPAGTEAYVFLAATLPAFTTRNDALRSVGVLAAHFCDAPVQIGLTLRSGVLPDVTDGNVLSSAEVAEFLYAAGASRNVQDTAVQFATAVANIPAAAASEEDAKQVLLGATGFEEWEHGIDHGQLPSLYKFVRAFESEGAEAAHAYVLGLAARCSYSVREVVYGAYDGSSFVKTAGLGRLDAPDRLMHVDGLTLSRATSKTLSHMKARQSLATTSRAHAVETCNEVMVNFFPDHADRVIYELLVSEKLYEKMGDGVNLVKAATAAAIRGSIVAPTLKDPEGVARAVEASTIRVAGAPDDTWGGRFQPLPSYDFASKDGALVMLLKAARALFDQRISVVTRGGHAGDLPPVYSSLSRNAYFWSGYNTGVLLPGLLVPPLADAFYDTDSLLSRVGWVVAHEFAHVTARVPWNTDSMNELLSAYEQSTHTEAIADGIATVAIHSLGVGKDKLCVSLSQVWCGKAKNDFLSVDSRGGSHPPMNTRGDLLCEFLKQHFYR